MQSNLPPVITDYINNLRDVNSPKNIRYNYFLVLKNIAAEISSATAKFENDLAKEDAFNKTKRK